MDRISLFLLHAFFLPIAAKCEGHYYTAPWSTVSYYWPEAPNSDAWIPTDCKDASHQLIFRKCENDEWAPDRANFESMCKTQLYTGEAGMGTVGYGCYEVPSIYEHCYLYRAPDVRSLRSCDLGVTFMELDDDEKKRLLSYISANFGFSRIFEVGGTNQWPTESISSLMKYENGEVTLHDKRCGRFGLPLKFSTKTVPVNCSSSDECVDMCLSLKASKDPLDGAISGAVTIEKCSAYTILIYRSLLIQYRCPVGYYRMEYTFQPVYGKPAACFSIRMFRQSISVEALDEEDVVGTYCNGTIMPLESSLAMYTFRKLAEQMQLTDGNQCLFGLSTNSILKYSDWNTTNTQSTSNFNYKWDRSMNYSKVLSGDSYLAVKSNGEWTWATDTVSCVLCMFHVPIQTPELLLQYNFLENCLELEVKHPDSLYRENIVDLGYICFAVVGKAYKSNLTSFPDAHSEGKYEIEDVGQGQYWCSGHNMHYIYLSSAVVDCTGMVFALDIVKRCGDDCSVNVKDFDRFVDDFKQNHNFVKVLDSAVVHIGTTAESANEYHFVAHLRLALQDDTIVDLDTNLVTLMNGRQIDTIFIYEKLIKILAHNDSTDLVVQSISSTEYCLHESTLSLDAIIWRVADVGETVPTSVLCPPRPYVLTRSCSTDKINGAFWTVSVNASHCHSIVSELLLELYVNFDNSPKDLDHLRAILQDNIPLMLPIDVFLTSRILQKVSAVTLDSLANILSVFDSLMKVNGNFLKIAAVLNSTNMLLNALDNILLSSHILADFQNGNASVRAPLIETFVMKPMVSGVSGVSLYRPRSSSASDDDFGNYSSRYISPNESIDELFSSWGTDNDLVIGSYLPDAMLTSLPNASVAIVVFFNDKLFQSTDMPTSKSYFRTNGKVISVTIFELDDNMRLPSRLSIFFESSRVDDSTCGYWSFASEFWLSDGCFLTRVNNFDHIALCECSHLTHFGYLVNNDWHDISETNDRALSAITIVGSSFSLLGNLAIFATAAVFPNWRNKLSSKILIHFSAAITLQMSLINVVNVDAIANHTIACIAMGAALHYSVLVMHFWMLIIAYFQFKRYVVVFNFTISHLLLKSALFAWVVPVIPIIVTLIIDRSLYLPINKDELNFCYPTGHALSYGVLAPVGVIYSVDLIVYISVVVSVNRGFSNASCASDVAKLRERLSQIRLSAFLFLTLGLTWIFGFLSRLQPNSYLVFTYLFCITSTVQGLVLFFYFTVLDPYVRSLWARYFKNILGRE